MQGVQADPKGYPRKRLRGEKYDQFVDKFVGLVKKHQPKCLLHFEDFVRGPLCLSGLIADQTGCDECPAAVGKVSVSSGVYIDRHDDMAYKCRDEHSVVRINGPRGFGGADRSSTTTFKALEQSRYVLPRPSLER